MESVPTNAIKRGELLWEPSLESVERATLTRYMRWLEAKRGRSFGDYQALWGWSTTELEEFWASIWDFFEVEASAPYSEVLAEREKTVCRSKTKEPPGNACALTSPGGRCGGMLVRLQQHASLKYPSTRQEPAVPLREWCAESKGGLLE